MYTLKHYKFVAENILKLIFLLFRETRLNISWKSSTRQTICMQCQALFSLIFFFFFKVPSVIAVISTLRVKFHKTPCTCIWKLTIQYLDRQALANSADPDQTTQNMVSEQGLHYLPLIQQFSDISRGNKMGLFSFGTCMVQS